MGDGGSIWWAPVKVPYFKTRKFDFPIVANSWGRLSLFMASFIYIMQIGKQNIVELPCSAQVVAF